MDDLKRIFSKHVPNTRQQRADVIYLFSFRLLLFATCFSSTFHIWSIKAVLGNCFILFFFSSCYDLDAQILRKKKKIKESSQLNVKRSVDIHIFKRVGKRYRHLLIVYNNYKSEVVQQNKRLIGFLQHQFIRFSCINGRVVCVRPAVTRIDDQ